MGVMERWHSGLSMLCMWEAGFDSQYYVIVQAPLSVIALNPNQDPKT